VLALDATSLTLEPGSFTALTGPSGCGKSTLLNALSGFVDISSGRITVDGFDLRDVTMRSYRSQMGVVSQEPFLFTGTVMDNIRYARSEATDGEVIAAARSLGSYDAIMSLQDGFETEWASAAHMSLGQRQRSVSRGRFSPTASSCWMTTSQSIGHERS
jgi:ATP-binding cassette subfamily B protein